MNISKDFDGSKFRTTVDGVKVFTPMFLVVVVLASTDIVFAVDSIPTIFGITQDVFIVWTSNMMAVIGMRPLYFLLQEIKNMFRFLKYGLSLILVFIGFKMSATYIAHWVGERIGNDQLAHFHLNTFVSLSIIIGVVFGSIILSSLIPEKKRLRNN